MRHFTNTLQLRLLLGLFFLALAVPSVILVRQAYSQLKWEAFYQYRNLAEELSARINKRFDQLITAEESRTFADYSFLVVSGSPEANYLQPSPLSRFPVESAIPGLIGYFQLDARGGFTTPLLPQQTSQAVAYGVSAAQLSQRQQLQGQIQRILSDNQLVRPRLAAGHGSVVLEEDEQSDESLLYGAPAATDVDQLERVTGPSSGDAVAAAVRAGKVESDVAPEPSQHRQKSVAQKSVAQESVAQESVAQESVAQEGPPASFERLKDGRDHAGQRQQRDDLSDFGRLEDLNLASGHDQQRQPEASYPPASEKRAARKEQSALPVVQAYEVPGPDESDLDTGGAPSTQVEITMFESEIDPFDFALMGSGHFVIYRNVWRNGERSVQGALIELRPFLEGVIEPLFRETGLSQTSDLAVAYQGKVFAAFGAVSGRDYFSHDLYAGGNGESGELLYQSRLSAPFSNLKLFYSTNHLPAGRGAYVIGWAALILAIVLLVGLLLMYRLGLRQIALARQQQDFVSAVSHELKTPLTSIRMYSEMLREGWVDPQKRTSYYDFIFDESARLSRLIANVLQLARMDRKGIQLDLKPVAIDTLFDTIRSKASSQVESAGFTMTLSVEEQARSAKVSVDMDCFTQVLINLVDNAIKFSSRANASKVDISARLLGTSEVVICVRDYGPGVPNNQMKQIFRLFYRAETELTRETVGTGIGLALVHQQVQAMGGKIDVVNKQPGAEFAVTLPRG